MWLDNNFIIATLVNFHQLVDDVRQLNSRSIHLYAQLLTEINLYVGHLESNCFGPAGMFCLACIVCYADRERMIDAIGRQLILASTLKAEKLSIKRLVVRIAKHSAHGWTFDAFCTTLTLWHYEILIRSTLYYWTLSLSTANFASATLARLAWSEIPSFIVLRREKSFVIHDITILSSSRQYQPDMWRPYRCMWSWHIQWQAVGRRDNIRRVG